MNKEKFFKLYEDVKNEIIKLVNENKKILAIGEIGLDYYWDENPERDIQKKVFREQMKLAEVFISIKKKLQEHQYDCGYNNRVIIHENGKEHLARKSDLAKLNVKFKGNNNTLRISLPNDLRRSSFDFQGNNNTVEISKNNHINFHISCLDDNSNFWIGENCHSLDVMVILSGNDVSIGNNCMFSEKILLLDDTHSVIDVNSKEVLNDKKYKISIKNHVWIGEHVTLLKSAKIPEDCIVAYGSIVTKEFKEPHSILAGNPAKIVKTGISWNSLSPKKYDKEKAKGMLV